MCMYIFRVTNDTFQESNFINWHRKTKPKSARPSKARAITTTTDAVGPVVATTTTATTMHY